MIKVCWEIQKMSGQKHVSCKVLDTIVFFRYFSFYRTNHSPHSVEKKTTIQELYAWTFFNQTSSRNIHQKPLLLLQANHQLSAISFVVKWTIIGLMLFYNASYAAGFAVLEQSVRGLGNAYSGGTTGGEDISTLFYNPAGLSEYTGTEFVSGGHIAIPEISFKSDTSSDVLNRPLTGSNAANAGKTTLIPNLYLATDLAGPFRLGLGITVPFGLGAKYSNTWKGRYEAINSQLKTIDINPAISYRINDYISVGFGFSAQYIDVELSNAIDFGSLCFGQLGSNSCAGLGLTPQQADGEVALKADDWSWGYNTGIIVKPLSSLTVGLAFRSKVKHHVNGKARFQVPVAAQPLTASGVFKNTQIAAKSDVPASLSVGGKYNPNETWGFLFDVTWTQWNQLDRLTTRYQNPSQPISTLDLDFKNTIRTSLGVNYDIKPDWRLRAGFAYDESPVQNAQTRTFRIPDSDRYWLTVGIGYRYNRHFRFNFGYAHVFIQDANIERQDQFGHRISGVIESHIDILSAELQLTL